MNVLVLYAHPYAKSLNKSTLDVVVNELADSGHSVDVVDLYKDKFDPVLNVKDLAVYKDGRSADPKVIKYQKRIAQADYLICIFPIWWVSMPAILKGFFDKVFLKDFAFDNSGRFPRGLLRHIKGAAVITTMSSPRFYYALKVHNGIKQDLIKGTLQFSGIKKVSWLKLDMVDNISDNRAHKWHAKIARFFRKL